MGPLDPRVLMGNTEKTALLIIDMQNDFVRPGPPLATPHAMEIVPRIAAIAVEARRKGWPVA